MNSSATKGLWVCLLFDERDGEEIEKIRTIDVADMTRVFNDLQNAVLVFADNLFEGGKEHIVFLAANRL